MKKRAKIELRALRSARTTGPGFLGLALLIAVLSAAALTVRVAPAEAATFTVNTTDDADDGACTASHCSLRDAIRAANRFADTDTISFNIPGPPPHTIHAVGVHRLFFPVIIDGTTQPGYAGRPIVELDGTLGAGANAGLSFFGGSSTVRGLVINRFPAAAIALHQRGNYVIEDNYIGTDLTGTVDLGNRGDGIFVVPRGPSQPELENGRNRIVRNVISGNGLNGILLNNDRSVVQGNYIGTDVSGTTALGNAVHGIRISNFASDNLMGGTAPGERNVISANGRSGIDNGQGLQPANFARNVIQGNYVGTNASGTAALGNREDGILSFGNDTTIGGTTVGARNIVSANGRSGITLRGNSTNSLVQGNLIGTAADGTSALGNGLYGIDGSFAAGTAIGGTTPGAVNTIAYNGADGVFLGSGAAVRNGILGNSIHSNGGLGIDLHGNGVTPNDPGDPDGGANELQNFPALTSARGNTIQGTLNSRPNTSFRLEFFANREPDPSGHGEGERFLGSLQVTTDGSGNASFTFVSPTPLVSGEFASATATDPANNTSEFSGVVLVEPGPPPPPPGEEVLNHFSCYTLVKTPAVDVRVDLSDQFGTHPRRVRHADFLCNPVTKEIEGQLTPPVNPDAHLKCYRIVPPEEPKPTRRVEIRNQLTPGGQVIQVNSTREVCAPATKDRPDLDPGQLGLDHFTCYSAVGPSVKKRALLKDQFLSSHSVLISKAQLLCNPTEKRRADRPGEVVTPQFPNRHLVCYRVEPNPNVNRTVHTEDQFRVENTTALVLKYLCVPSEKRVV